MSEAHQCYLCAKSGELMKLFRNCNHELACYDCLRDRYVTQAQHVSMYPLKCFHPECNRPICNTQMRRLVRSEQELHNFHRLDKGARFVTKKEKVKVILKALNAKKDAEIQVAMHQANWGKNWREVWGVVREALGDAFSPHEIRPCPQCRMLITKNGGCSHMICLCGCNFHWTTPTNITPVRKIEESFRPIEERCGRLIQIYTEKINRSQSARKQVPQFKKKKATRAPPLVRIDEEEEDDFAEDYSTHEHDVESPESTKEVYKDLVVSGSTSDLDSISFPSVSLVEANGSQTTVSWEQDDFDVLELASDASWSQFDCSSETTSSCNHTVSWEEVSEVSSVVSFHSKTGMSFLEAARAGAASSNEQQEDNQTRSKDSMKPKRTKMQQRGEAPEDDFEIFGPEFLYEGAKGLRGGKAKFRFNHENNRKYVRYDQRRRSVARQRHYDYVQQQHHQRPKFATRLD